MSILSSVALGWLGRRVLDWGGWLATIAGALFAIYTNLDPATQQAVTKSAQQFVAGHWRDIPLGQLVTAAGAISLVWSQRKSFKATVTPQIVTRQGQRVDLGQLPPQAQATVTTTAQAAPRARTLADLVADKLARR